MSGMTIGYTVGAALLWAAGLVSTIAYVESQGAASSRAASSGSSSPLAIAWTAVIAAYLVWASLRRPDEERLLAVLRDAYRLPAPPVQGAPPEPSAAAPAPSEPASPAPPPVASAGAPAVVAAPEPPTPTSETPR